MGLRRSYRTAETTKGFRVQKGKFYYGDTYATFEEAEKWCLLKQAHDAQRVIDEVKTALDEAGLVEYNDFHNYMC